jgi:2-dehydro-3-deoxyphosphooctonate aldolase (KDO 8-P synthase)
MDFQAKITKSDSFPLLLGPCVIESEALLYEIARKFEGIFERLAKEGLMEDVVPVFKASYDKANRTSINSYRGPGLEAGLKTLAKIRADFGYPLVSDVHEITQVQAAAEVLDIIQIPAFLCRQTDLINAAASTGKILNIKKGQFLSPPEIKNIVDKCKEVGNTKVFICERGNSFGYNNLVVDMRMFEQARQMGIRTIFDATHSCQMPGAGGDRSLGNSHFAPILARAAVAAGATGLFAETHPNPNDALSDGPNMIALDKLEECLRDVLLIRKLLKKNSVTV